MTPQTQQNKSIIIAISLIVLLLGLIFIFAWQKNKLFNTFPVPSKTNQTSPTPTEITQDTETTKTEKQKIIEQIAPNTDLAEFDLPEYMLSKKIIEDPNLSPAYNRYGNITNIDKGKSILTFLDTTFDAKEYEIIVTPNTYIQITTYNQTYTSDDEPILLEEKTFINQGTINDLQIDDTINVRAEQMINSDSYEAKYIETNHFTTKILNN